MATLLHRIYLLSTSSRVHLNLVIERKLLVMRAKRIKERNLSKIRREVYDKIREDFIVDNERMKL